MDNEDQHLNEILADIQSERKLAPDRDLCIRIQNQELLQCLHCLHRHLKDSKFCHRHASNAALKRASSKPSDLKRVKEDEERYNRGGSKRERLMEWRNAQYDALEKRWRTDEQEMSYAPSDESDDSDEDTDEDESEEEGILDDKWDANAEPESETEEDDEEQEEDEEAKPQLPRRDGEIWWPNVRKRVRSSALVSS